MLQNQRILFDDNGTEKDWSLTLNEFLSGTKTLDFTQNEDYLYIASDLPFNHRYFLVETANDQAATPTIEIWDGSTWNSAVDVIDGTSDGTNSLAQNGIIQWKTDREKTWAREQDSEDVTGVSTVGLYNMYWVRFSWSASLNASTALQYVGFRFCDDDYLFKRYPDLSKSNILTSFASGKTDWQDQHFLSAERILADLRSSRVMWSPNQILDYEIFEEAAAHKCAEIVYFALGRKYDERRNVTRKRYNEALNLKRFNLDQNRNANLSDAESAIETGFLYR